jgi:hypothetical protein
MAAQYVDILQILLFWYDRFSWAAANTGKVVNLKRTIYESHETCSTEGFRLPNENGMVDRGTMFDTKI